MQEPVNWIKHTTWSLFTIKLSASACIRQRMLFTVLQFSHFICVLVCLFGVSLCVCMHQLNEYIDRNRCNVELNLFTVEFITGKRSKRIIIRNSHEKICAHTYKRCHEYSKLFFPNDESVWEREGARAGKMWISFVYCALIVSNVWETFCNKF